MRKLILVLAALSFSSVGCNGHTAASKTTVVKKPEGKDLQRVVALEFVAEGIKKSDASSLESSFCHDLFSTPSVELLCPGDLAGIIESKELQVMTGECADGACLSKIAEKTNAQKVITGKISKVGGIFIVSVNIADGESGNIITRIQKQVDSKKLEDLLPAMKEVAQKVGEEL